MNQNDPFIGREFAHYRITELLGQGGMGSVYKAQDTKLGRTVALKFLPTRYQPSEYEIERFIGEARALSLIDHPNISTIFGIEETPEGATFISMGYCDGHTLADAIATSPLSLVVSLDIAIQVAEGLSAAHAQGVYHRDVKPANIMILKTGMVKIVDFGLAKLKSAEGKTKTGSVVGTAAYMSPEQARGEEVDQRSDIFSLGTVLYEMIAGQRPFKGEHELAVLYEVVNIDPPPLTKVKPGTPEALERIVSRALCKSPDQRYESMRAMGEDLRAVRDHLNEEPRRERGIRRPVMMWSIAGVVTAIALYMFIAFFSRGTPVSDAGDNRIAVLPFRNLNPSSETDYLCAGITDDLISQLSKIRSLRVIAPESVHRYREKKSAYETIGAELHVGTILDGSVRLSGNTVRVIVRLIECSTEENLWADTYEGGMGDVFRIQNEVAQGVAQALRVVVRQDETERISKMPTASIEAYALYLRGREYYSRYTPRENEISIQMFKSAVQLDSQYALAYSGLADAYAQRVNRFGYNALSLDSATRCAEKALVLDSAVADGYKAYGLILQSRGWYDRALSMYNKAVELNPSCDPAIANIGSIMLEKGRLAEAVGWLRQAVTLNPAVAQGYLMLGEACQRLREDSMAREWYQKALDLQPEFPAARAKLVLLDLLHGNTLSAIDSCKTLLQRSADDVELLGVSADAWLYAGGFDSAARYYGRMVSLSGGNAVPVYVRLRLAYIDQVQGRTRDARAALDSVIAICLQALRNGEESPVILMTIAGAYATRGEHEEAITWLGAAVQAGWTNDRIIMLDPLYRSVRNDTVFQTIIEKLKTKVSAERQRLWPSTSTADPPSQS